MAKFEVGNNKQFKTISEAIVVANDGDEIIVEPSLYSELFEIDKELYIHSSVDLTKAKNNFSSDDIPIICIKSFETLKISAKCKIENLLFTQKRNLTFDSLQDVLVRSENAGKDISSDNLVRKTDDEDFLTMIEISADVQGKNCFFIFGAYHGVTILNGKSNFERTTFSNNYADNILVFNNAKLELSNGCYSKFAVNGNGLYACGESEVKIKNSEFIEDEGSEIDARDECNIEISDSKVLRSNSVAISIYDKAHSEIINCNISNNKQGIGCFGRLKLESSCIENNEFGGILLKENGTAKIDNCSIDKNSQKGNLSFGVYGDGKSVAKISNSKIFENDCGIFFKGKSSCTIFNIECYSNLQAGVGLNDNARVKIEKSNFKNNHNSLYASDKSHFEITDTDLSNDSKSGLYIKNNSTTIIKSCNIHNCVEAGIELIDEAIGYISSCKFYDCEQSSIGLINKTKAVIEKSEISKSAQGIFLGERTYTVIDSCCIRNCENNAVGIIGSAEAIIENSKISNSSIGICSSGESIINVYNSKILNNKNVGVASEDNASGHYLHCDISNNGQAFARMSTVNKHESFFNCTFLNNEKEMFPWNSKYVKNVSKNEEDKIYENIFRQASDLKNKVQNGFEISVFENQKQEAFQNESQDFNPFETLYNSSENPDSKEIVCDCIEKIADNFGSDIFYKENLSRFISACRDFYPDADFELKFLNALSENEILEQLARKKISENFLQKLIAIMLNLSASQDLIVAFIVKAEKIFNLPLHELISKKNKENTND